MKNLNQLLLIFIILNTTACKNTINQIQDSLSMDSRKRSELITQCNEIDSEGNIFELLKEIKGETDNALSILSDENLILQRPGLEEIATSVNNKSKAVISLSKDEWVTRKWDTEITWSLKRFNFNDILVNKIRDRFEILSAKLVDIYYLGEKRNDLIDYTTVSVTHDEFQVKNKSGHITMKPENYMVNINYKNSASSLELCQLHQTMMIIVEVEYRNKLMKNKSVFNLNFKRDL